MGPRKSYHSSCNKEVKEARGPTPIAAGLMVRLVTGAIGASEV